MEIDARNITCPRPVVMTLEGLQSLPEGETLDVLINDEVAHGNLSRLAEDKGIDLDIEDQGDYERFVFMPKGSVAVESPEAEASAICDIPATGSAIVAFGANVMGRGNDELGHVLIKGLIYALAHQDNVPKTALFYNGGASLTCEGSESLEDIKELEERGCTILTCGTCLDYLNMREKLAVGGVTNLYEIAQIITNQPGVMVI